MVRWYLTILIAVVACHGPFGTAPFDFKGKIALVTGGSRGIGLTIASELLSNGVRGITIVGVNVGKGTSAAKSLNQIFGHGKVIFIPADVGNSSALEDAFKLSFAHWKGLDIMINNAGIVNEVHPTLAINTNIVGTLQGTYLGFRYMSKSRGRRGGVILNVASVYGIEPLLFTPVYSGTKAWVIAFSRVMGLPDYYDYNGVRVLTLCPGLTDTEILDRVPFASKILDEFLPGLKERSVQILNNAPIQSVEVVGKGAITILGKGESGSVWVVEHEQVPYEVKFPDRESMKKI
ncbi:hypothetical protein PPYR_14781 [Photinus pyralis]|uniref:Alcohol dehydrogenase n=1 Tax=Photinus pyralis TaxID=7054 RepID=A0A5N4A686_PHOPY|nr:15-hydroxyprostaglandin dehydrogenase [NAD(+)]-like [Photinus pyralis]KAB0792822.1 hypothetical protein PPYR_14781 [Photinus pyralis]